MVLTFLYYNSILAMCGLYHYDLLFSLLFVEHFLPHNRKIYFCLAMIKLFKHAIKKEALAQMFFCEFCKFFKNTFFKEHLWVTASKQVTVPLQCLQMAKSLIGSCRRTGETNLSNYQQNPKVTATVHYFHYNSHDHYHYYHFHYHCKMHLYCLKILLTI